MKKWILSYIRISPTNSKNTRYTRTSVTYNLRYTYWKLICNRHIGAGLENFDGGHMTTGGGQSGPGHSAESLPKPSITYTSKFYFTIQIARGQAPLYESSMFITCNIQINKIKTLGVCYDAI